MALTREDVELLRSMMREEIRSEIAASEERTRTAMREEIRSEIAASETRMMTYMENTIEKKIDLLAEGQLALSERMDRMQEELDDVHSSVLANEIYIIRSAKQKGSV